MGQWEVAHKERPLGRDASENGPHVQRYRSGKETPVLGISHLCWVIKRGYFLF